MTHRLLWRVSCSPSSGKRILWEMVPDIVMELEGGAQVPLAQPLSHLGPFVEKVCGSISELLGLFH